MIYLAARLNYITDRELQVMLQNIDEVCRLVYGLIRSIKT